MGANKEVLVKSDGKDKKTDEYTKTSVLFVSEIIVNSELNLC